MTKFRCNGSTGAKLFKFRNFYDQVDFSPKQRLAIAKAIIELTDPLEGRAYLSKSPEEVVSSRAPG